MEIDPRHPTPGNGHGNPPPLASTLPHQHDLRPRPNVEVTHDAKRGVRAAQGMAWFSVGLGLTQILAPRLLGRAIGVNHGDGTVMRLLGVRELATGLALLSGRHSAVWSKARVAGDFMDLALIGIELLRPGNDRGRLAAAAVGVLGATALDLHASRQLEGDIAKQEQVARVTHAGKAITIDAPARELYDFWRNLSNLPRIFDHLKKVEAVAGGRSRWVAEGPAGTTVHWESEIVEDRPGELIAWRTVGGPFESSGSVRFLPAPGGRGTEVVVDMHYALLGRVAGKLIAFATGREPGLELSRGLRVLKQRFEIGEPMRSDASIHKGMHPGMPPAPGEERLDRGERPAHTGTGPGATTVNRNPGGFQ